MVVMIVMYIGVRLFIRKFRIILKIGIFLILQTIIITQTKPITNITNHTQKNYQTLQPKKNIKNMKKNKNKINKQNLLTTTNHINKN
jgi:hypothetical protein